MSQLVDPSQPRLAELLLEKERLHEEKMGTMKSMRQAFPLLAVLLGLMLNIPTGVLLNIAYLFLPWLVLASAAFMLANLYGYAHILAHLKSVDLAIAQITGGAFLTWHIGRTHDGSTRPARLRPGIPHPNEALALAVGVLLAAIVVLASVNNWTYLDRHYGLIWAISYTVVTVAAWAAFAAYGWLVYRRWLRAPYAMGGSD